jgi:glycosyltransferase involved in cell wall biosynthesis
MEEIMKISFVVPTYNRKDLLQVTLSYLEKQFIPDGSEFEVIVVDDGSTDGTDRVVNDFKRKMNNLIYCYRKRDHLSCRSRTRNIGIKESRGEVICFIDCGMIVPPHYLNRVIERYSEDGSEQLVLSHFILGKTIDPAKHDVSILEDLTPESFTNIAEQIMYDPLWTDRRTGIFDSVNDDLTKLSAPWAVGFDTAALTVSKALTNRVLFDETYLYWGLEDRDFVCSLYFNQAVIKAERSAFALHLPHPIDEAEMKTYRENNDRVKFKIHQKFYRLDTELKAYYHWAYMNDVLARYNHQVLSDAIPNYSSETIDYIHQNYVQNRSLLIGNDSIFFIKRLKTTNLFVHNLTTLDRLSKEFPNKDIRYLLGCSTPYEDHYFKSIVITDFYRMLPDMILKDFLIELNRIGEKVILIHTHNFTNYSSRIDGHPLRTKDGTVMMMESVGLNWSTEEMDTHTSLIIMNGMN